MHCLSSLCLRLCIQPQPKHTMCYPGRCMQHSYILFLLEPWESWDEKIMHFCPCTMCRRWNHRRCLIHWGLLDSQTKPQPTANQPPHLSTGTAHPLRAPLHCLCSHMSLLRCCTTPQSLCPSHVHSSACRSWWTGLPHRCGTQLHMHHFWNAGRRSWSMRCG